MGIERRNRETGIPTPSSTLQKDGQQDFRRSKPPAGPVRNIDFPQIPEARLDNGMRVIVVPDARLPRVAVQLGWPVGRAHDSSVNLAGVSLAIDLLDKGTERRSCVEIADETDQYAIHLEKETLLESTSIQVLALSRHLERAFDLLSDMVLRPAFPEEELEKLKPRWKSNLVSQRSQPAFLARERVFKTVYDAHPYSRVAVPLEDLERCGRDAARDAYRRRFGPNGAILMLAGPINLDQALDLTERWFGEWRSAAEPAPELPERPPLKGLRVRLVHRPHSVQSRIMVSGRVPPKPDPELIPVRVANQILGGGGSARLFLNLREDKGYTYGAYSYLQTNRRDGLFLAGADVRAEVALSAVKEVLAELETMTTSPPADDELGRCKSEMIGSMVRQMETPSSIGNMELMARLNQMPRDYYRKLIPAVDAVDLQRVHQAARQVFNPENLVVVVVGDREKVEKDLRSLGTVEIFDSQGEAV